MNQPASHKNSQLQSLQTALVQQHDALLTRLSDTKTEQEMLAISVEMDELYLRIRVCTRLLFRQTSDAIDKSIQEVVKASDELKHSIADVKKLTDLIKGISKFLGLVDKILDKIKVL